MHIIYIHQHFAIPQGSTGTRSYEFARRWVKAGHKVTMITGHYDIGGLEYTRKPQRIDGIKVIIAGAKYSNKMSFLKRVFSFLGFIYFSFIAGLKQKDIDIVFATSTPLTVGIPAILLKWFRRKPFVFEVRDEWPRIPVEMGIIKNKLLIKFLYWLEKFIYKQSSAIVALSPGMASGIRSVIGPDKQIEIVPNSSDTEVFRPDINGITIRKEHNWNNKFVCLHFGAMGRANGLEFLVEAADKLKDNSSIHFVCIGDGATKQALLDKVSRLGLQNIEFLSSQPKTILPEYVAACDISMVIFANYSVLEHNSANKFFDSLAAGKPILLNYGGWQENKLKDYKAGLGCKSGNLDDFVDKILFLDSSREELAVMGKNARQLALKEFNRDFLASNMLVLLEHAAGNK